MTSHFPRVLRPALFAMAAALAFSAGTSAGCQPTWRSSMPAPAAPLATTIAPETPRISGITTAARAARDAGEAPVSAATLAQSPQSSDIAQALGLGKRPAPAPAPATPVAPAAPAELEEDPIEEPPPEIDSAADAAEELPSAGTSTEEIPADEQPADPDADLPPQAIAIRDAMQKRIDRVSAQKTEAAERATALEAELTAARQNATRPEPTRADPLAHILSDAELAQAATDAQASKQWALRNRNGGEIQGADGPVSYDADDVANILANAEAQLDAIPARREWLGKQESARRELCEQMPEFYQKGSPAQKVLAEAVASIPPAVRAWRPDIELILGHALVGKQALLSRLQQTRAGTTNQPPKAPPTPGGRTAPRVPTKVVTARESAERLQRVSKGGERELAAALADRLNL